MIRLLLVAMFMQIPCLVHADAPAALSSCVADNTSGQQRKDLARWVFLAMAAHPELTQYTSSELDAAREPTDRSVAQLFEYLITQKCAVEANVAFGAHGTSGLQIAFEQLGRLAMLELMSNADTSAAMSTFEQYLDRDKINAALNKK